jgi:hypothetical protein
MRKLRKKIYKKCKNTQANKRQKDISEEIAQILSFKKLPEFITSSLKNKRNFQLYAMSNFPVTN